MDTPKQRDLTGTDIDRITQVGRHAVEKVQAVLGYDRSFVIAGGLFRDTLCGGPVQDVDVFVLPNESNEVDKAYAHAPRAYGDLAGPVVHIGHMNEHPIQKIVLNPRIVPTLDCKTVCARIDIGICRIAMDQDGTLYFSEEAMADFEFDTLTVLRTNGADNSRVRARLEKMMDRYPGRFISMDPQGLLKPEENLTDIFDE